MQTAGKRLMAVGAGIVTPLVAAAGAFAEIGSNIADMAARTGVSTNALSEFGHAAQMTGAELSDVEVGIKKMQKTLVDAQQGSKGATDALSQLGLTAADLLSLSPEKQFETIAQKLSAIQNPAERTALALELFGKSGTKLLPMMGNLEALTEEARRLGLSITPEQAAAADELGDAWDRLKGSAKGAIIQLGAALAPILTDVADRLTAMATKVVEFIKNNKGLVVAALASGAAIAALGGILLTAGFTLSALGTAIGIVGAALSALLSPIGLVAAGIGGLIFAWAKYTESGRAAVTTITEIFGQLAATVQQTVGGIFDAIAAGDWALAGSIALTGLQLAAAQGLDGLQALFGDTVGAIANALAQGDIVQAGKILWAQLKLGWLEGTNWIRETWVGLTDIISRAFRGAIDGVRMAWVNVTTFIAKTGTRIFGFIMNMAKKLGVVQEGFDTESALAAIEEGRKSDLGDIAAGSQEFNRQQDERSMEKMRAIEEELAKARAEAAKEIEGTPKALDTEELSNRLKSLTEQAAKKAEEKKAAETPATAAAAATTAAATKKGIGGVPVTFSAESAIAAGFRGMSPQQQMNKHLDDISKTAKRQAAAAERTAAEVEKLNAGMAYS